MAIASLTWMVAGTEARAVSLPDPSLGVVLVEKCPTETLSVNHQPRPILVGADLGDVTSRLRFLHYITLRSVDS